MSICVVSGNCNDSSAVPARILSTTSEAKSSKRQEEEDEDEDDDGKEEVKAEGERAREAQASSADGLCEKSQLSPSSSSSAASSWDSPPTAVVLANLSPSLSLSLFFPLFFCFR